MNKKIIIFQKRLIMLSIIIALIIIILYPVPQINVSSKNVYKSVNEIFFNNLIAVLQLMIPVYNSLVLFLQIVVNLVVIKITIMNHWITIVRILPHMLFEITSVIISLQISIEFINLLVKKQNLLDSIIKKIIIVTVLIFIGAIVEYNISGRI